MEALSFLFVAVKLFEVLWPHRYRLYQHFLIVDIYDFSVLQDSGG